MNYDDLLNEYLDGTISESSEQVLFTTIAQNEHLRKDFNESILLRNAVRKEAVGVIPPAELTSAIFGSVGYSTSGLIANWISKYWSVVTSALLTGVVIWLWFHQNSEVTNFTRKELPVVIHDTVKTIVQSPNQQTNNRISLDEYYVVEADNRQLHLLTTSLQKRISQLTSDLQPHNEIIQELNGRLLTIGTTPRFTSQNQNDVSEEIQIEKVSPTPLRFVMLEPKVMQRNVVTNAPDIFPTIPIEKNLEIALRSTLLKQQNGNDVPTNDNTGISNVVMSGLYKVHDNFKVGLELGREPFAQQFNTVIGNKQVLILQNPTVAWGGLCGRYEVHNILSQDVVTPYALITGGISEVGGIGRGLFGFHISPDTRLTFDVGVEATRLFYSVQSSPYTSDKIGFFYGVSFGL